MQEHVLFGMVCVLARALHSRFWVLGSICSLPIFPRREYFRTPLGTFSTSCLYLVLDEQVSVGLGPELGVLLHPCSTPWAMGREHHARGT